MTTIDEIVNNAIHRATQQVMCGQLNLQDIIYQAVQAGMADAFERGVDLGKKIAKTEPYREGDK